MCLYDDKVKKQGSYFPTYGRGTAAANTRGTRRDEDTAFTEDSFNAANRFLKYQKQQRA